jgi:hypothetical protein
MTAHTFRAVWELEPEAAVMGLTALRREACNGPLQDLLHEASAQLLVTPEQMAWWEADGRLHAEGPARPWADRDTTTYGRSNAA